LTEITLPGSITEIGSSCFDEALMKVYYKGTKEQFSQIFIGEMNEVLFSAEIVYLG
jgi:hypothetical protein